jgi:hypothetical protein
VKLKFEYPCTFLATYILKIYTKCGAALFFLLSFFFKNWILATENIQKSLLLFIFYFLISLFGKLSPIRKSLVGDSCKPSCTHQGRQGHCLLAI